MSGPVDYVCSDCKKPCYYDAHGATYVALDCKCRWPAKPIRV
jgi:hypothetical protein